MNITDSVKKEILPRETDGANEKKAYLCALVKFLGSIGISGGKTFLEIESKHNLPVITAVGLIKELCDVSVEYGSGGGKSFYVRAEGEAAAKIFSLVGEGRGITDLGDTDGINSRQEAAAYARGAFLASGSAYIPSVEPAEKSAGYHIEFLFFGEDAALEFQKLLHRCALSVQTAQKGNYCSVYAKSEEAASDALVFMGATDSMMLVADVSVRRETNNSINRVTNCSLANMEKSQEAVVRQLRAINALKESGEYEKLDDRLKATCEARLAFKEASLEELAAKMGISKSGLNHRLARITALGERKNGGREKD